ncbi:MAG: PAS domain-containing protein, partial [Zoogloea sp.]
MTMLLAPALLILRPLSLAVRLLLVGGCMLLGVGLSMGLGYEWGPLFGLGLAVYLLMGIHVAWGEGVEALRRGLDQLENGQWDKSLQVSGGEGETLTRMGQSLERIRKGVHTQMESEHALAAENLRIRNALDKTTTNIMLADNDGRIVYCNEAVLAMLRSAEADLRKALPSFSVQGLLGRSFDDFHKNPAHQRNMLARLTGVYRTAIQVGGRHFGLIANPVLNPQGQRLGTVVEWVDCTLERRSEHELEELLQAAVAGDFSRRLGMEGKQGFFVTLATGINRLMDTVSVSLDDLARVLNAIARGDLTEKIEADYGGLFGQLKDDTNTTVERLREVVGQIKEASEAI